MEIGSYTAAEIVRFADIDDGSIGVFHQIATGLCGKRIKNALNMRR